MQLFVVKYPGILGLETLFVAEESIEGAARVASGHIQALELKKHPRLPASKISKIIHYGELLFPLVLPDAGQLPAAPYILDPADQAEPKILFQN